MGAATRGAEADDLEGVEEDTQMRILGYLPNTRGQEVLTFTEVSVADIWVSLQQQPTDLLGHNPPSTH